MNKQYMSIKLIEHYATLNACLKYKTPKNIIFLFNCLSFRNNKKYIVNYVTMVYLLRIRVMGSSLTLIQINWISSLNGQTK